MCLMVGLSTIYIGAYISKVNCRDDSVADVFAKRYSGYAFDATKIVTQDQLKLIMQAAQSVPSSYNDQPWNFIICDKTTNPDAYDEALSGLVEFNQKWAVNAPVLVICIASINSRNQDFNHWAQYDTGAAAFGMMIQATALGLMAHQMGGFNEAKLRADFAIPQNFIVMAVMAIGYPATERQIRSRERKPLSANFFAGSWNNGIDY